MIWKSLLVLEVIRFKDEILKFLIVFFMKICKLLDIFQSPCFLDRRYRKKFIQPVFFLWRKSQNLLPFNSKFKIFTHSWKVIVQNEILQSQIVICITNLHGIFWNSILPLVEEIEKVCSKFLVWKNPNYYTSIVS